MKISEAFEGENSSLRKAFNQAVNTPDTEDWEKEFDEWFIAEYGKWKLGREEAKQFIRNLLTSRDTYWKERVEEIYSHFSWCQECAEGPMCKDALAIKDNLK